MKHKSNLRLTMELFQMDNSLDSNVAMSTAGAAASIVKSLAARNSANSNFSDSGEHKNTLSFISASDLASSITPSVSYSQN
ncbi:hypothetical protein GJ496_008180 [Pomphorhynchus laevis]|nr:hypothetical protein GJ496_008180 [Pomphorhynchus laevis]